MLQCDSVITNAKIGECFFAALDFESAGAEVGETDVPVQIGIARQEGLFSSLMLWESYIYTDKEIQWSASRIHGITKKDLIHAPTLISLWIDIRAHLSGAVIVGHNLGTEKRFLRQFPGHGFSPWLDTLVLARECMPSLKDYSLEAVSCALGIVTRVQRVCPGKSWHNALFDATASLFIVQEIVSQLSLESLPLYDFGKALKY